MQTTVDFLRHGEAAGGSYYRGSTDDLLTPRGWEQMRSTVSGRGWDQIISSPLHRCNDFAQTIHSQKSTPVQIEPSWQEIHFGNWEGKTASQINSDELMRFYQDPIKYTPTNGEHFSTFITRVDLAWKDLLKTHQGKHILVITHAGVIRCLFSLLLNLPVENIFKLQIDHASITRFNYFHDTPHSFVSLAFHNLTT